MIKILILITKKKFFFITSKNIDGWWSLIFTSILICLGSIPMTAAAMLTLCVAHCPNQGVALKCNDSTTKFRFQIENDRNFIISDINGYKFR